MKHAVHDQKRKFPALAVSVGGSLLSHPVHRDDNVSQHDLPGIRIKIILIILFQRREIARLLIGEHRERQNVRRCINLPVHPVDLMNSFIVRQRQIHFRLIRKTFMVDGKSDNLARQRFIIKCKWHVHFDF